jgi:hypothetical protein
VIDAGNGKFAIHGDVYSRKTSDLDIKGYAVSSRKSKADGTPRENRGKLVNSSADGDGGALGASLTFDNGYLGASYSTLNNNYGTVAEEAVRIDMKSDRWDLASEFRELGSIVNRVKFRLAHTDYEHKELEERHSFLVHQQEDLVNAKDSLMKAIQKINKTTKELFIDTFQKIQVEFKSFFRLSMTTLGIVSNQRQSRERSMPSILFS